MAVTLLITAHSQILSHLHLQILYFYLFVNIYCLGFSYHITYGVSGPTKKTGICCRCQVRLSQRVYVYPDSNNYADIKKHNCPI